VGRIESMDDVSRTCANICGVILSVVDVSAKKPLLYQVAHKFIRFIENKKTQTWMRDNSDCIAHILFVLMGKLHQFFQLLASFSQNSINTNKVEINDDNLDVKQVNMATKLTSKFIKKMTEHIEDGTVPKEIPPFAKLFFVDQESKITHLEHPTGKPTTSTVGGKRKSDGTDTQTKKKRDISDKSLNSDKFLGMGIFHLKKGTTPVSKALPEKSKFKNGATVCLEFCCHGRKCKFPRQICEDGKHYTSWKYVPDDDKAILLAHMNDTGLLWFDEETMKKHNVEIPSEYSHLLGDATGPKSKKST
jgi:hypothetical protein